MYRKSQNGYELSIAMHYVTNTGYRWELIRYPLDPSSKELTETILVFYKGSTLDEQVRLSLKYAQLHPEDGVYLDVPYSKEDIKEVSQ